MKLVFSSIKNGIIFEPDFQVLDPNSGTLEFKHMNTPGGIVVVYAPNGTGKSSLTKVLSSECASEEISFSVKDDTGVTITPETKAFHIIPDQINRNVIRGKETDYLIGQQIRREYELRDRINAAFDNAYSMLSSKYKNEYKVSKVTDYLLTQIGRINSTTYQTAHDFLRSIVNNRTHGKDIEQSAFVSYNRNDENRLDLLELDAEKREWIVSDLSKAKIAERIIELDYQSIVANTETTQIERHDDAIGILKKYHSLDTCIVCDNHDFHGDNLLEQKKENRKRIYDALDRRTKELLDNVIKDYSLIASDPFDIKRIISAFVSNGDSTELQDLQVLLSNYVHALGTEMINSLLHCFDGTTFYQDWDEYNALVTVDPQLDSEELLYIEDVINECIGKDITLIRDSNSKNYKLKLGDKDLIGTERNSMELSSGEQNFISLAFELLMARHSAREYVVLDDPISSFDSVYKNKIAFCIIKFLEDKKQIVLTHNTDLVRLMDVQMNNCFNLYILNNAENGRNGFIPVSGKEKKLLINLHELVKLFQNKDDSLIPAIRNRREFLMSMIPFMRGYTHISLDPDDDFGNLSGVMHGYATGSIDAVSIYKKQFGYDFGGQEDISVEDILNIDLDSVDVLDSARYPLLAETLRQTLAYYTLRMRVEKELVESFRMTVHDMDSLNQIIRKAFDCGKTDPYFIEKRNFKVFFTSRKTLLNEFNHFEGNMNIFQPAIDITTTALQKEIDSIMAKLEEVRNFAAGIQQ